MAEPQRYPMHVYSTKKAGEIKVVNNAAEEKAALASGFQLKRIDAPPKAEKSSDSNVSSKDLDRGRSGDFDRARRGLERPRTEVGAT